MLELHAKRLPLVLVDNVLNETPVDAILGDNQAGAYAAARHLVEHGIYKEQIGRLAAARLLDIIAEPGSEPARTLVNTRLVIRQSCGCSPEPS